jgi:hypothetical protein
MKSDSNTILLWIAAGICALYVVLWVCGVRILPPRAEPPVVIEKETAEVADPVPIRRSPIETMTDEDPLPIPDAPDDGTEGGGPLL